MQIRLILAALILASSIFALAAGKSSIALEPNSFPAEMKADVELIGAVYREYPNDPSVLYQVAALHAQAGHKEQALEALKKMAATGAGLDPRSRNFATLAKDKDFLKIKGQIQSTTPAVISARLAYTIAEGDLMPEGIAYSEKTRKLYLG